jgi:hypothetical protein
MAFNFKSAAAGAGTGALTGASVGGPWGALAGGIIGGVGGLFNKGPKPEKFNKLGTLDPTQKQLYDQQAQALQGGGGPLADVYGQFNPQLMKDFYEKSYAQPQYQEFQENIVPTITGQFRGQNLQNSSYLGGALSKAGTNVQNNLNGQMAELLYKGQQSQTDRRATALDRILNLQTHVNQRPQPSVFDDLLATLNKSAGDMLTTYLKNKRNNSSGTNQSSVAQPSVGG